MLRTTKIMLAVVLVSTFLNTGVMAGIEPSPFQPQINQLYASENILSSIEHVVTKTMENPPIEGQPSPNLNGALNKLEATDVRVTSVSGFITSIYEEVMGTEPSPFRIDIVPALQDVKIVADDITIAISDYLETNPLGVPNEFKDALGYIQVHAVEIAENAQQYINELTDTPPGTDCAGISDPDTCNNSGDCQWVPDDTGGGECRDIP